MLCSGYSQSNPTPNGDWLYFWLYFSHVKKVIRDADWTYRFLHMWNINIEFYLLRLSHENLSIDVIKYNTSYSLKLQIMTILKTTRTSKNKNIKSVLKLN